jgi:signal transduction histidine kinase
MTLSAGKPNTIKDRGVYLNNMTRDAGRHSTKLSVLFVAAILIPGCVLAYFSVQNVGSQKELAEKKLLEEEKSLATEIGVLVHDELLRNAATFFAAGDKVYPDLCNISLPSDVAPHVAQPFALDGGGQFLWPRYAGADPVGSTAPETTRFLTLFASAEREEFAVKNLTEAAGLYREAAKTAVHDAKRAAAINGLARVLAKSNQAEQAAAEYETLLEHYGSLNDENGASFARYALHQLMRISSSDPMGVFRRISSLLSRFENGEMPLTDQTEPLLREVEQCLEQKPESIAANALVPAQLSMIRGRLTFMAQDAPTIALIQSSNPASVSPLKLGPFEAIVTQVAGNSRLFVIRRDANQLGILGYQVALEHLRSTLLERGSRLPTSLKMEITIAPGSNVLAPDDPTVLVQDLSPLLPWWRVSIRPQDPEIISRYVARRRWIYGTTLALLLAGMFLGVALVLRDLSREQRLSRLRSDFVANVTHELKTPLTSIRMFAETLRMGRIKEESERQECLDVIVSETQRLSRLISNVLDFSKIERGQKQYQMAEVNVSEVAESTLGTLKYSLEEQGFRVETEIEPQVRAIGDADALEQAMLNLINNAVKYSQRNKSVRIQLCTRGDKVLFSVADKGIGIPENEQGRIFDKFYRARAGNELDTGGAGLGLTVVKHVVAAHRGDIRVESKVGEGSSFTIILPGLQGTPRAEV